MGKKTKVIPRKHYTVTIRGNNVIYNLPALTMSPYHLGTRLFTFNKTKSMYVILINPETFEVHHHFINKDGEDDFEVVHKETPPNKDIYDIVEINDISGLNWSQVVQMIYSDDSETKDMIMDQLRHYNTTQADDNKESLAAS